MKHMSMKYICTYIMYTLEMLVVIAFYEMFHLDFG